LITATGPTKRKEFYYFTETKLHGIRYGDFKFLFVEFRTLSGDLTSPTVASA